MIFMKLCRVRRLLVSPPDQFDSHFISPRYVLASVADRLHEPHSGLVGLLSVNCFLILTLKNWLYSGTWQLVKGLPPSVYTKKVRTD